VQEFSAFWTRHKNKSYPRPPRIGFAEATDPRIQNSFNIISKGTDIQPFLIGDPEEIQSVLKTSSTQVLSVSSQIEKDNLTQFLLNQQKKFGVSEDEVQRQLCDPLYQGVWFLFQNKIDGLIAGATRSTADVLKAALRCLGPRKGQKIVSGQFLIESIERQAKNATPFLFADCAVVPEPSPRILASIAVSAAESYRFFTGAKPKVALLSFSTKGSAEHLLVDRIKETLSLIKAAHPDIDVDGELQVDAALDAAVANIKHALPSPVAPEANVFIFPNLESGNIGYKLIQRFSPVRIAGPLLWGLARPMSDLSRGCSVQEIIDTAYCVADMSVRLN